MKYWLMALGTSVMIGLTGSTDISHVSISRWDLLPSSLESNIFFTQQAVREALDSLVFTLRIRVSQEGKEDEKIINKNSSKEDLLLAIDQISLYLNSFARPLVDCINQNEILSPAEKNDLLERAEIKAFTDTIALIWQTEYLYDNKNVVFLMAIIQGNSVMTRENKAYLLEEVHKRAFSDTESFIRRIISLPPELYEDTFMIRIMENQALTETDKMKLVMQVKIKVVSDRTRTWFQ